MAETGWNREMERVNKILKHDLFNRYLEENRRAEENRQFCHHDMGHFLDVARLGMILFLQQGSFAAGAAAAGEQSGRRENGQQESGQRENGQQESGQRENGQRESGQRENGQQESGQRENGQQESGQQESGGQESGQQESGGQENGQRESGVQESGGVSKERSGGEAGLCGVSQEQIYAAALLHDIGRWKQYEDGTPHEKASAELAPEILADCGFAEWEIVRIVTAILNHRNEKVKEEQGLSGLLYRADKMSRSCFCCEAEAQCGWKGAKKNMELRY